MSPPTQLIVGIDSQTLAWGLRGDNAPDPREMTRRARWLFEYLDDLKAEVVIATIAIAECLAKVDPAKHWDFVSSVRSRFQVVDYCVRAAAETARVQPTTIDLKKHGETDARKTYKADLMICAVCRAFGATAFYSDDEGCRKMAQRFGMDPLGLPTRPLVAPAPKDAPLLFDRDEEEPDA